MGYTTQHAIRIINKYNTRKNLAKLRRAIKIISNCFFETKGSTLVDFSYVDDIGYKWYDCLSDMRKISRLLPKLEIEICGKGEEEGDEWCFIYKNGKQYISTDMFIESEYDSDFNEETESNHCSDCFVSSDSEYSENEECEECEED